MEFTHAMQKSLKLYLILLFTIFSTSFLKAQGLFTQKQIINQYTTVGIGAGTSHEFTDLSTLKYFHYSLYTNVRWNVHAHFTRYFSKNVAGRLQLSWVRLLGDDYTYSQRNMDVLWSYYIRNLHYRNDVKEATLSGIFNLIPSYGKGRGGQSRLKFTPYFTVGIGLAAHSPMATTPITGSPNDGTWTTLRDKSTSGQIIPGSTQKQYSLVIPVLPIGMGARVKLNKKLDLTFEGNLRLTNSDYIDDVAKVPYPDQDALAAYLGDNAAFSFRATEAINSRNKINRIPLLQSLYSEKTNNIIGPGWSPDNIQELYGPERPNTFRGGSARPDFYFTTQVTLSYILSDKIKCPVLK